MNWRRSGVLTTAVLGVIATALLGPGRAQDQVKLGFKDTPMLPGGRWHVHDGDRPQPAIVTPGTCSTQGQAGRAPADAVLLFDGTDLSHWQNGRGGPAGWTIQDGAMIVKPGSGAIASKEEFGDCQLHLEFATPVPPRGRDQGRGNSGVLFFGRYEIQVLDSFENLTYPDGQAAAIYGQYPPLVNASRPPGQWQTYDILFTAPRFRTDGALESPAYFTVLLNGVLVHNHTAAIGPMAYRALGKYRPHGPKGRLVLQEHGNPVRFRNVWVRPIRDYDQS
jgi:hypothetical protein